MNTSQFLTLLEEGHLHIVKTFQEQNPAEHRSLVFEALRKSYLKDVLFER